MPSSTPAGQDAPVVEGCLVARTGGAAILRYPLSTALPIPLAVAGPPGIRLATWAFAGLRAEDSLGPRGLLVLALDEGVVPWDGLRLVTHFREFGIALGGTDELLLPEERMLAARAVLAAASPNETALLSGLVELLGDALSAIAPDGDAPMIAPGDRCWVLSGSSVPGHLLLCGEAGWSCHRIARADLHFEGEGESAGLDPQAYLTLDRIWGASTTSRPSHAIGLTTNGFTPYRIAR